MLVDDDELTLRAWERNLKGAFELSVFSDAEKARAFVLRHQIDLAMIDVFMPGVTGFELLETVRASQPAARAVMLSGQADPVDVVRAMRLGASDFLTKPITVQSLARRLTELATSAAAQINHDRVLVGESPAVRRVRSSIDRIAMASAPVLLRGEAGTEKELLARAIHQRSPRRGGPFVAVGCAELDKRADVELFGHARGAFKGAAADRPGLIEAAHGGVLFLDDIGELPKSCQARLLRTVRLGEVRRVGATRSHPVDVRVVAASASNLRRGERRNRFRQDLLQRLSVFQLTLPPLREHLPDLPALCSARLESLHLRTGAPRKTVSAAALALLEQYAWPGNLNELDDVLEHAAGMAEGVEIDAGDLPSLPGVVTRALPAGPIERYAPFRAHLIEQFDRDYLTRLMTLANGVLSHAARLSGIDRANIRRMLKRYGLTALYGERS